MTDTAIPHFPVRYRLRLALEIADMEPDELAQRLGCHPNTVTNYLAGRTRPKRMALIAIAHMTGVPVWWLEGFDSEEIAADSGAVSLGQQSFAFAA